MDEYTKHLDAVLEALDEASNRQPGEVAEALWQCRDRLMEIDAAVRGDAAPGSASRHAAVSARLAARFVPLLQVDDANTLLDAAAGLPDAWQALAPASPVPPAGGTADVTVIMPATRGFFGPQPDQQPASQAGGQDEKDGRSDGGKPCRT